jgi:hypothetical protein
MLTNVDYNPCRPGIACSSDTLKQRLSSYHRFQNFFVRMIEYPWSWTRKTHFPQKAWLHSQHKRFLSKKPNDFLQLKHSFCFTVRNGHIFSAGFFVLREMSILRVKISIIWKRFQDRCYMRFYATAQLIPQRRWRCLAQRLLKNYDRVSRVSAIVFQKQSQSVNPQALMNWSLKQMSYWTLLI